MCFPERVRFPRGFRCAACNCGLKEQGHDLALFVSDVAAAAAAVCTRNRFPGAPVILGRETIGGGVLRAVVVNSRVSNVATGAAGVVHARRMAAATAREVGTIPERVLVGSTGVIGVPLPIEKIEAGLSGMGATLGDEPLVGAGGIMTTDTFPKAISLDAGAATITLIGKGAGMIEPNLATMLVYIFTDAAFAPAELDALLRAAVHESFTMLSIDTDTSTSDTVALLENGPAGPVARDLFERALHAGCVRMTELIARDGEGASKLLRVQVTGAASETDAHAVAKSLVTSPLIKTMVYGADPNVGRILMAIGKCFDALIEQRSTSAAIGGIPVISAGERPGFDEAEVRRLMGCDPVDLGVDLRVGNASATASGCDLTEGYIRENAAYYSS